MCLTIVPGVAYVVQLQLSEFYLLGILITHYSLFILLIGGIYPEGHLADHAIGSHFAFFDVYFKILYVHRINIVYGFGNFADAIFNGFVKTFF